MWLSGCARGQRKRKREWFRKRALLSWVLCVLCVGGASDAGVGVRVSVGVATQMSNFALPGRIWVAQWRVPWPSTGLPLLCNRKNNCNAHTDTHTLTYTWIHVMHLHVVWNLMRGVAECISTVSLRFYHFPFLPPDAPLYALSRWIALEFVLFEQRRRNSGSSSSSRGSNKAAPAAEAERHQKPQQQQQKTVIRRTCKTGLYVKRITAALLPKLWRWLCVCVFV